ncbi:BsuPI-related putative proteinase inhibitor [Halorubrum laminariae]|uniref:Intracellular proteinase inhibitor BsuPI domain-containing protein n=1 Tax=Halorubrum laminariae TaxID=1433523 RepID=A0ABD6BVP8_9EURY|nr:BsuPI-related putative proteinase inhibitor [Halorubrum laminariae]
MPDPSDPFDPTESPDALDSLAISLSATVTDGETGPAIELALTVRNDGGEPVTLRFPTGQRAEFAVYPTGTERNERDKTDPVWRHGEGRLFTQAVGTETLTPGESETYEGTWDGPSPGKFVVVGWVTAAAGVEADHDADWHEIDDHGLTATVTVEVG